MPQKNKTQDKPQTIKFKFWCYVENSGDGSAYTRFFDSEEAAERYAKFDQEYGDGFTDSVSRKELEFTLDGQLVITNPVHREDDGSDPDEDEDEDEDDEDDEDDRDEGDENTFADDEIIGIDEDGFVTMIGTPNPELIKMLEKVSKKNK